MIRLHRPAGPPSGNAAEFQDVFVHRVHRLVALGYGRLAAPGYASAEETVITGDLVEAIDAVLDDGAEPWMSRFFVSDDPPVNDPHRKGRHRKRVDLRVVSSHTRPRARFCFEAKRLAPHHPVSTYVGDEGLGCFLRSEYAAQEEEAGMRGYVQSRGLDDWAEQLAAAVAGGNQELAVTPDGFLSACPIVPELSHTFRSTHRRASAGRPIRIYHTLLMFHE